MRNPLGGTLRGRNPTVKIGGRDIVWVTMTLREGYMRRNICGGVLLVLVALAGCARQRDLPPMFDRSGDRPVRLTVQNNRFEDAAIYAHWRGGPKNRVGLATGATASTTFTFDWVSDIVQ